MCVRVCMYIYIYIYICVCVCMCVCVCVCVCTCACSRAFNMYVYQCHTSQSISDYPMVCLILSVSIPLCFINLLDIFITVNTTNNWL
jgi:hypothetical protein